MKNIVIIGAGPAGITAAYELLKDGKNECNVTVLEESETIGGISRTINVSGNRIDIGGHRFFSKDKRIIAWWQNFLKPQGRPSKDDILLGNGKQLAADGADPETEDLVMLLRTRISRIYYKNTFFDYPVTLNASTIRSMGLITAVRAGFSYLAAACRKRPEDNLENFYINRFGKLLYSMFFEGYTEKLWGRHPREISAEWGAQRVKGLSVKAVLKDIYGKLFRIKNRKVETSLIEWFLYPKYGPGQLWTVVTDEVRRLGGKVLTGKKAIRIIRESSSVNKVICADGSEFICDALISSMSVKDLVDALEDVPSDARSIASGLPYRDFQTVGILIPTDKFLLRDKEKNQTVGGIAPDCWIYVQDTSVVLGRIQVFNNWSPYMVKEFEKNVWLGLEYFCDEGDTYWEMSDEAFIKFAVDELVKIGVIRSATDVLDTHRERIKKAYPAYFDTYTEFETLRTFLDSIPNLYCVGRNGQHRYNNMDHSMVTAFAAAGNIVSGSMTKDNIWNINTEQEYHEEK
jgi:protoporphyrinogen oxidase